jgi:hypothetical protein
MIDSGSGARSLTKEASNLKAIISDYFIDILNHRKIEKVEYSYENANSLINGLTLVSCLTQE